MPSQRTMLFTDIEGSTTLARACGVLWPAVLSTHGRLMVDAIDANGGDIERTEGDSFFATFDGPKAAVAAAVAAQTAMAAQSWPDPVGRLMVRMGVHTGVVDPTDRYYVGLEIHRAARIMAAAHGGQILASQATRAALGAGIELDELGPHRLRDFPDPVELFHVRYPGGPAVRALPPPRTLGSGASLQLLQRDVELDALIAAVRRLVGERRGGAVLVQGPAGIGKSSLIAAAVERAADDGARVLETRGTELESGLAFGAARELLTTAVMQVPPDDRESLFDGPAHLARAVLGFGAGDQDGDPLFGLFWLTVALAERQPILLVVDDLHWLDEESARFVAYLAQRVEGLPILLLAAARPAEPGGEAAAVAAVAEVASVLIPRPLGADAVAHIVRDRSADEVLRVTGGNPLLAVELARSLIGAGPDIALDEVGPRTVGRAVLQRVSRVSDNAVALSRAVAISPDALPLPDLAELAGLAQAEASVAADALVRAQVLADDSGRLTFLHPVMRTAVYEELDPFARRRAHAHAARLLGAGGADVERIAPHLLASDPAGDPENVRILQAAADEALRRAAPRAACRYLERALEELPPPEQRTRLLHELGSLQHSLGRPEAVDTLRQAFEQATELDVRVDCALELGEALVDQDRPHEAVIFLEGARSLSESDPDRRLDLDALILVAAYDDVTEPAVLTAYAARIPHDVPGTTPAQRRALAVLAYATLVNGGRAESVRSLLERVESGPDPLRPGDAVRLVQALSLTGQFDRAERLARELLARGQATGEEALYASGQLHLAVSANQRGDLRSCEDYLRLGLEAPGLQPARRVELEDWLVTTLSMQGRFDEAEDLLNSMSHRDETFGTAIRARRRMELALDRGDFETALTAAEEAYEVVEGRMQAANSVGPDYALILAGVGRTDEAVKVAQLALERAETYGQPQVLGISCHALGCALPGTQGLVHLERAVEILTPTPYRWNLANAEVDLGRVLLDLDRPDRARPVLTAALEYAVANGAGPIEKRVREQLARIGVHVPEPSRSAADTLTATEERIAKLAASGLSDTEIAQRLFLTTRTVGSQLEEAVAKLGLSSRDGLAGALEGTSAP